MKNGFPLDKNKLAFPHFLSSPEYGNYGENLPQKINKNTPHVASIFRQTHALLFTLQQKSRKKLPEKAKPFQGKWIGIREKRDKMIISV